MKPKKTLFFKTALSILVACAVLSSSMLLIAAYDEDTLPIDGSSVTPPDASTQVQDTPEGDIPADGELPSVEDPEIPEPQTEMEKKFAPYSTVTQENGKSVITLYTPEQIADFNARREAGEWFNLNDEEVMHLIADTRELFFEYDVIRINNLDGTTSQYYGYSFYSEGDYLQFFGLNPAETDATFNMSQDMHYAIIDRIKVVHTAVSEPNPLHSPSITVVFTGFEAYPDVDEYADGQTELNRLGHQVTGYWYYDHDYWDNFFYNCYSGGAFLLKTDNSLLNERAYYISEIANSDKEDFTLIYKSSADLNFGKYEYATEGDSVVMEVWDDTTETLIARVRITDADEVATAKGLWDAMIDYLENPVGYEEAPVEDYFTVNNYSVVVFMNGAEGLFGKGTNYFHYRADYKPDIWSFGEYQQCYQLSGCGELSAYLNSLLTKYLTAE